MYKTYNESLQLIAEVKNSDEEDNNDNHEDVFNMNEL
jgi:hypothetical protein